MFSYLYFYSIKRLALQRPVKGLKLNILSTSIIVDFYFYLSLLELSLKLF